MKKEVKKIVLAYSGGLDTSVILKWLINEYGGEVITFSADLGQGEEIEEMGQKALATGASKAYVEDLKEEFVTDFVFPMLRANTVYEVGYLLGTSIARPLIAKKQMEIVKQEKADAVSHGATGKGNDQVRFELTYLALDPSIKIIAPWRQWNFKSRRELIDYAKSQDISLGITKDRPFSIDRNLFHCSFEGGILEDPWAEPPEDIFQMTISPEKAPDKATILEISYERGNPVEINGERVSPAKLLATLNSLGGENGIGRIDIVENRFVGMKSRGVYETPGGTILHHSHKAIESITMDREVMNLRDSLIPRYAQMIYNGFWFSPERELLQKAIDESQKDANGVVRLKLYKGNCTVLGRKSENSLYDPAFATFEEEEVYNQKDATGFIKLNSLRLRIRALREKRIRDL